MILGKWYNFMSTLAAQHSLFTGTSLETVELEANLIDTGIGFYPSTFIYSRFSLFLYCLLSSVAPWGGSMVGTEGKIFEIWVCRSLENAFFLDFSWKFTVSWLVLKKSWLERYIHFSFMSVCKYLNQRVRNRWIERKIFQGCFKNKKIKKRKRRLSFITQFKIDLLPFNGCRKVLGKMPEEMWLWYRSSARMAVYTNFL